MAVPPATQPTAVILLAAAPERADAILSAVRSAAGPSADDLYLGARLPVEAKKYEPDGREIAMEPLDHTMVAVVGAASLPAAQAAASAVVEAAADVSCLALVGEMSRIHPGTGPVLGLCVFRRRPATSRATCYQHWRTIHAELAGQFPGHPGYAQLYLDAGGPHTDDYDGVALVRYRDLDAMAAGRNDIDYFRKVTDDEKRFLDHSRSSVMVFTAA